MVYLVVRRGRHDVSDHDPSYRTDRGLGVRIVVQTLATDVQSTEPNSTHGTTDLAVVEST